MDYSEEGCVRKHAAMDNDRKGSLDGFVIFICVTSEDGKVCRCRAGEDIWIHRVSTDFSHWYVSIILTHNPNPLSLSSPHSCHVLCPDNGKEFIAKMAVDLLVAHNPNIWLIQGCSHTPRDRGSVESANKVVQRVLKAISEERHQKNLPVNWKNLLGQVMSVCNSQTGIRRTDCSSYQAVFGQRIHHHLRCSVEDVRKCTSIHQRLRMSPDE